MAEKQSDDIPAIQNFLAWADAPNTLSLGCQGTASNIERPFIPLKRLQAYFHEPRRINSLLKALLKEKDVGQLPASEIVRTRYPRVFSILILIGRGRFIDHFVHHEILDDQHLPLEAQPQSWPSSTEADFFESFCAKQWLFYPAHFEHHMDRHFGKDRILPIVEKEVLGEGGSAIVQRVILEDESNALIPFSSFRKVRRLNERGPYASSHMLSREPEAKYLCRQDLQNPCGRKILPQRMRSI